MLVMNMNSPEKPSARSVFAQSMPVMPPMDMSSITRSVFLSILCSRASAEEKKNTSRVWPDSFCHWSR